MLISFSVSQIDRFREWEENEDGTLQSLISDLSGTVRTEDMLRGLAFHKALEHLKAQETDTIEADGFTFFFDGDFEIPDVAGREVRGQKNYAGLTVRGRVDAIFGRHIVDDKAATWFDAERYMKKYAWRYYLDMFNADRFTWYVWEMEEDAQEARKYVVRDLHKLEQFRYPDLEHDCKAMAMRVKLFAEQYLVTA